MVAENSFIGLLAGFDLKEMDRQENSACGLWPDLTFAWFNEEWFRFAARNGGEPRISREWPLGRSLLEAIPEPLRDFYRTRYLECLAGGRPWDHDYECSSPETYRLLHQTVYPLGAGRGLLVVNSITVETPMDCPEMEPATHYVDPHGIVHQCIRCRKIRHLASTLSRWDWVPAWVAAPPPKVSHGLCPVCIDFYYPGASSRRLTPA